MARIDFICSTLIAGNTTENPVIVRILVGCGGACYIGNLTEGFVRVAPEEHLYEPDSEYISCCTGLGKFYIVDGENFKYVNASDYEVFGNHAATEGDLPENPRYVFIYRNRLGVLTSDNTNFFLSKIGDHGDFDYGSDADDRAVAGNPGAVGTPAGTLGEPQVAWIPFSDDCALICCTGSLWMMRGDPTSGGSINNLSGTSGLVGPKAWCRDGDGNVYVLTRTGILQVSPGGAFKDIAAGRVSNFFREQNLSQACLCWDDQRRRLMAFFAPYSYNANSRPRWLCWEQIPDSFSVHRFGSANIGPTFAATTVGSRKVDRATLLGGYDGRLRYFNSAYFTDDGNAIESYVRMRPLEISGPGQKAIITRMQTEFTTLNRPNTKISIYKGDTPQAAIDRPHYASAAITVGPFGAGRACRNIRTRGQSLSIELANSSLATRWGFQGGFIDIDDAGGMVRS